MDLNCLDLLVLLRDVSLVMHYKPKKKWDLVHENILYKKSGIISDPLSLSEWFIIIIIDTIIFYKV